MFKWYENNYEDRFYELGKEVETFANMLKEKYNFLHSVKDKDQRALVEKKINDLIDDFKYKVSSLGDDVESGTGPFTLQVGEINGEGTIPGYERACDLVNRRIDALPAAEIIGGRIVADDGTVVAMLRSGRVRYVGLANWYSIKNTTNF